MSRTIVRLIKILLPYFVYDRIWCGHEKRAHAFEAA